MRRWWHVRRSGGTKIKNNSTFSNVSVQFDFNPKVGFLGGNYGI